MAKKQKSFAEKASSTKGKDLVHVKFVKSVPSDKEGFWRFNESMIGLEKGQKLDAALKQMEDEANLVDIEMPSDDSKSVDTPTEQVNTDPLSQEAPKEETPASHTIIFEWFKEFEKVSNKDRYEKLMSLWLKENPLKINADMPKKKIIDNNK